METVARYEWVILLLGFLGLLVWELQRTRRDIRRAEERKKGHDKG